MSAKFSKLQQVFKVYEEGSTVFNDLLKISGFRKLYITFFQRIIVCFFLILPINRPLCARNRVKSRCLIKNVRTAFRVILSAIHKFKKPNKKLSVQKSHKLKYFQWFLNKKNTCIQHVFQKKICKCYLILFTSRYKQNFAIKALPFID